LHFCWQIVLADITPEAKKVRSWLYEMLALVVSLKSSILYYKITMLTGNLYRAGMAAFVIGLLMLFGQAYLFTFSNAIITIFIPRDIMGYYANYAEFYFSLNAAAIILIIAGVVMFYRGRKERNAAPA
jgi:hypothetical protein